MGKLVVTEFITLDGVIEDPGGSEGTANGGWSMQFPTDEGMQFKFEELQAADVQLLGRITYQGFAAAWPAMEEETGDFGKKMNDMPKVVVSGTLTEATWRNTTIESGDVFAAVNRLKEQTAGDVLVAGSASLAEFLRVHDLVDEYRLMVYPIVVGQGKRLFTDPSAVTRLRLVETRQAGPDVPLLILQPVR
ncbi:MAG TPA: dihydrofolate reductase family protein [Micromonosporaceae bacterium]|nr:dihydrofolate reductase family protein [Micromonosporaceae bacterium]